MSAPGGLASAAEAFADEHRTPAQRAMDDRDWSFGGAWPYAPCWHRSDAVRLHYVDEGARDGLPVVMLHGNATWSFLYRHLIEELGVAGRRAIAVDQLGFGRSDKPHRLREYSLTRHIRLFDSLLAELELEDVTLVAHGWGGPVALSWATRHPERMRAIVLINAFVCPPSASGGGTGARVLLKGAHRGLRRFVWDDPVSDMLGQAERSAYQAPHPSWDSRTGILAFAKAASGRHAAETRSLADETTARLDSLRQLPTAIMWGMDDPTLPRAALDELQTLLPAASVERLDGRGHLVPESAPVRVREAVLSVSAGAGV